MDITLHLFQRSLEIRYYYKLNKDVALENVIDSPFIKNKSMESYLKLINLRKLIKNQNPDVVISFLPRVNVASALSMIGIKSPLIICERTCLLLPP